MTIATIRAALESRLNGISPAIATAWENADFTPTTGTPWQRVDLMVNDPVDYAVTSDVVERRGFLQVTLFYPRGVGTATVSARAEAVATRFAPVQTLTSGATNVEILSTATIHSGIVTEEWFAVPISVPWRSFSTA